MAGLQTRQRHTRTDTSGRRTTSDERSRRSGARARDREIERAYKAGLAGDEGAITDDRLRPYYDDGRRDAKREKATKRRAKTKRTATRRARSTRRQLTRDARKLAPAAAAQIGSGMALAGMTLGLVALYLVLTNVPTFSGALGGVAKALRWLADPTTSIPYRKEP